MKKKIPALCLAGTILLGTLGVPSSALSVDKFTDVKASDWFYSFVQYVAEKEYMVGVADDKFAPEVTLTRAMFVTILYKMDGTPAPDGQSGFVDVADNSWYAWAVSWAVEKGITSGVGGNRFDPDSPVTREQMCVMMTRFLEYRAEKDNKIFGTVAQEKTFPDAALISIFAKEAVKQCQMWGLIGGDDNGYMNPQDHATRAEVATVIQRLDELLAAGKDAGGGGGGGGGGGSSSTTETAQYTITASFQLPETVTQIKPEVWKEYSVTIKDGQVTGDKTLSNVLTDLTSNNNENTLNNLIQEALTRVKDRTTTQTVNGQQVTVSISEEGVISAFVSMKVTDLTGGVQTFAMRAVTQDQLEDLIGKLQGGGSMSFNKDEVLAMGDLLDKIEEVQKMTPEQIQEKIDQVVAENPDLEQVVSGITPEEVQQAAGDYKGQVEDILTEIGVSRDDIAQGNIPEDIEDTVVKKEPVLMNVAMDLGAYYDQAMDKFTSSREDSLSRMEAELYPDGSKTIDMKLAGALYDLNSPANYVTNNRDGTLTLKEDGNYLELVHQYVDASCAFYESLGEDAAFYESLLKRAENKYQEGYDISYEGTIRVMAALLGDSDGILVDENKDFRDDMTFRIKVNVDEDTYGTWLDLITGKWGQAGSMLPGEMPEALNKLLGDYTLTFTIDKQ